MTKFKYKKEARKRWKQRQMTWEEDRQSVPVYRDGVRKARAHLELNLVTDVKGNRKDFYRYASSKRQCAFLLNGAGELVTKDMEKFDILNVMFTLIFTDMICLWES